MKSTQRWAIGLGLLVLCLGACASCSSGGPPPPTTYKYYAYVAMSLSDSISAFSIDPESGALTAVAGITLRADTQPRSIAIVPSGKFAYVVGDYIHKGVYAYSINASTGALTAVPGLPFYAHATYRWITVDPSGRFVYVVSSEAGDISAFSIGTTGALSPLIGSPFAGAGGGPDKDRL